MSFMLAAPDVLTHSHSCLENSCWPFQPGPSPSASGDLCCCSYSLSVPSWVGLNTQDALSRCAEGYKELRGGP